MFRLLIALCALFVFASAQQYYAQASAYPYLTGAYAPSNLAGKFLLPTFRRFSYLGGVPAVVEAAYPASYYGYYPSAVVGK